MNVDKIMIFFALLSFIMGVVYILYFWTGTRTNRFLIAFFGSKVFQSMGLVCMGLREEIAWLEHPWLGLVFMTSGFCLEVFTFISYDLVFRRKQALFIFGAALLGILTVLLLHQSDKRYSVFSSNMALSFVFFYGAWVLWQKPRLSRFAKIAMGSFSVFAMTWLYAALHAMWTTEGFDMGETDNLARKLINVISLFNFTIVSLGYIMVLKEQDEWQLRLASETIAQDNQKLLELNTTKNQFFSIIAHDLRGPLGSMAQMGEMLSSREESLEEEERVSMSQALADSLKNSFILLENLLLWARSESGLIEVVYQDIKVADLVQDSIRLLNPTITQKHIKVEMAIPADLSLHSDASMLSTVFRNLLSNAVKYVQLGGEIRIYSEKVQGKVSIHFQDNGIGIPEDKLLNLFALDSRYSSLGTSKESGSGLGLKLCKQFTDRLGAELKVQSAQGKGSTFTLVF